MEKQMVEKGLSIRGEMFGAELAQKAFAAADDFNRPFEELVDQYCFGEIWGRPGLDRKTRSIVTLSMLTGLNRPNQIRAHVKGAIANGVSKEELESLSDTFFAAAYLGLHRIAGIPNSPATPQATQAYAVPPVPPPSTGYPRILPQQALLPRQRATRLRPTTRYIRPIRLFLRQAGPVLPAGARSLCARTAT